ncbi:lytic transglycosylase domain-containing protein [Sulfurospirillum sp. 1307]|jgi:soluble lytic murein transglycosylase
MHFKLKSRVITILCLFPILLLAQTPKDLSFFEDKPKSIAKDYYIYRYLKKDSTTSTEALKLLEMTSRMSTKLFHAFASKIDEPNFKKASKCMKMKLDKLLKSDDECLAIGLSLYDATKLDKKTLKDIETKLNQYDISKLLHVIYAKDPFKELLKLDKNDFFEVFNNIGSKFREKYFDEEIDKETLKKLENSWQINTTIKLIITDTKLKNINKSLIHVDRFQEILSHKSLFFLGLNALKFGYNNLAMAFFEEAYKKAYYQLDKDKVLFWQFLVSNDKKYKKELQNSFDLNIYTLLAGVKNKRIMIAKAWEEKPNYNISDPFNWTKLLLEAKDKNQTELENLANEYLYGSTLPHFSFLMEKASGYKDHYFPMPYSKYLKGVDKKRIALIYAIARQESRLVPSAISHSYALGMMQFMPFLAKAIAKQKNLKNFDLDDMFKPKIALDFANTHLDYLEKYLHNPFFIAYAYNGGIGFTKRMLKSGLFLKGKYEPFLSIELVPYDESRKYAKKVVANYVTYMHILHQDVSIYDLVEDTMYPQKSDEFRK